jgi:integrase
MQQDSARSAVIKEALTALQIATAVESREGTVHEAVQEYCDATAGQHKPRTEENRNYYLDRFAKQLEDVPLADLTSDDVELWLATLPAGSHHNACTVLDPFLNWATANGWPSAYEAKTERKRDANTRERYLSWEEFAAVVGALDRYAAQPRSRQDTIDALWMSMLSPFRSGEVVTLRASEISPMGDYVSLEDSKTGRRKVWLGQRAQMIVRRRRQAAGGWRGYLFPGREGKSHLQQQSLSKAWRRLADSIGLHDVVLHDLRRTWASLALYCGERMETIRLGLGHSTKYMTARYAHLADQKIAESANRVERELLGCTQYQLELELPEPADLRVEDLNQTQRSLVACPGSEIITKGPGQAQSAKALVRRGVLIELRRCVFQRTDLGNRLRERVCG